MEQVITPAEQQLMKLYEVAPESHRFDPNWFLVASYQQTNEVEPINSLAKEVATRFGDPRGVMRLIAHYSQGGTKISQVPPHLRMCLWEALSFLIQNSYLYAKYSAGEDTTK